MIDSPRTDFVSDLRYQSGAVPATKPTVTGSALPFWALMTFTFVMFIAPHNFLPVLRPFRIARLAVGVAIATYVLDRLRLRQPLLIWTREMRIVACLAGWAVLTVPFSYWPGGSVSVLLNEYLKSLIVFWLLSNVVDTPSRLRQMAWGLSLMAVPLAASGVNNYLLGQFWYDRSQTRIIGYEAPLTANPNDLAMILNLILPLTVALFLLNRRPAIRLILLAVITLNVFGVIVTFSRAGFLTLGSIFVIYLWKLLRRPQRGWAVAALVIALVCMPLLPSTYWDRMSTITNIEADPTGSAQARFNDLYASASLIIKHPIVGGGVGMSFLALNEERGELWLSVHNVYLRYGVELGIPGLVLFVLLLAGCIKSATFVKRRSAGVPALRELFYLAEGVQVSLIAFAISGLFSPTAYHMPFYYFAGLAIAAKFVYEARGRNLIAPARN